jgi:hypothetical protein
VQGRKQRSFGQQRPQVAAASRRGKTSSWRAGGVGGACDVGGAAAVGDLEIWDGDVYAEQNGGGWGREAVKQGRAWSSALLASEAAGVGEVAAVGDFGSRGRGAGRRRLGIGGSRVIIFF